MASGPGPTAGRDVPVAIVGGGVAGLSAAWRLERAGLRDFVVLELEDVAGGTSRSGTGAVTPYPWGAHYVPVPHAREPPLVAPARGGGRGRRTRRRRTADLRGGGALPRAAGAGLLSRASGTRASIRASARAPTTSAARRLRAGRCGAGRRWRDARGRRAFALPARDGSDDADASARSTRRARWPPAWTRAAGRRRACAGSSSTPAATTSARRSRRRRRGPGSTTSRAARRARGRRPAEFLTWPEGNGRLVRHLAGRRRRRACATGALVDRGAPRPRRGRGRVRDRAPARSSACAPRASSSRCRASSCRTSSPGARDAVAPRRSSTARGWSRTSRCATARRAAASRWRGTTCSTTARRSATSWPRTRRGRDHGADGLHLLPAPSSTTTRARRARGCSSTRRGSDWVERSSPISSPRTPDLRDLVERVDVVPVGPRDGAAAPGLPVERRRARAAAAARARSTSRTPTCPAWPSSRRRSTGALRARARARAMTLRDEPWLVSARWDVARLRRLGARSPSRCCSLGPRRGILRRRGAALALPAGRGRRRRGPRLVHRLPRLPRSRRATPPARPLRRRPDRGLRRRRPALLASPQLFWRVLAYLAVLHFVRQQYGWVALYRAAARATSRASTACSTTPRSTARRCIRSCTGTRTCRASSSGSSTATSCPGCPRARPSGPSPCTSPSPRAYVAAAAPALAAGVRSAAGKNLIVAHDVAHAGTSASWSSTPTTRSRSRTCSSTASPTSPSSGSTARARFAGPTAPMARRLPAARLAALPRAARRRRLVARNGCGTASSGTTTACCSRGRPSIRAAAALALLVPLLAAAAGHALRARRVDLARAAREPGAGDAPRLRVAPARRVAAAHENGSRPGFCPQRRPEPRRR